uniref:hypothetical protein n=1 Tax=Dialister sp. TaxID=1955814 RepID=UPI0040259951
MKLWNKRKYAWLTMAVMTALFSGTTAMAATYDQQINEDLESNCTYWDGQGVRDDGTYAFKEDAQLSVKSSAVNTNGQGYYKTAAAIFANGSDTTIDMGQHHLSAGLTVNNTPKRAAALGVYAGKITIKNAAGIDLSLQNPDADAIEGYGIYVKPTNSSSTETGLVIENGDTTADAVSFHNSQNSTGIYAETGDKAASIRIKGLVDIDVSGSSASAAKGIVVKDNDYNTGDKTTVSIGGGKIKASGLAAEVSSGELDINAALKDGVLTAAEGHRDVQIDGNIIVQKNGLYAKKHGTLALALNTGDSYLNGSITQGMGSGDAYVLMSHGASWKSGSSGSSLQSFAGGSIKAETGYIFRNAGGNLNLGKYSGFTTVFYDHSGDGTDASSYVGGDTVITSAAKGSGITLLTHQVDADNKDNLAKALNALASKLVYSAYTGGENNLAGKVGVVAGLTASSKTLALEDITFTDEGRGSYEKNPQTVTEFTTTITGVAASDTAYADGGVLVDGSYQFKKDSTITTTGAAIQAKKDLTVTSSKKLALHASAASGSVAGISQETDAAGKVSITASKLTINASTTDDYGIASGVFVKRYTENAKNELSVKGDMDIHAVNKKEKAGSANGIYAEGNSKITIDGNVKTLAEGAGSEWGYTYVNGIYAKGTSPYAKRAGAAAEVVVNGNVDISGNGNGLLASLSDSTVTVNGGGKISVNKDNTLGSAAIRAEEGTVNMNVKLDESGNATSSAGHDVQIEGNVAATVGSAVSASDTKGLVTKINLGLDTASSTLTGAIYNAFGAEGTNKNTYGNKLKYTFKGETNLWLSNGAVWNNELHGNVESKYQFTGSHVTKLTGGSDAAHAGNIFQNDTKNITIDNYSGNTNIYYAHTGNGEAASDYTAGDTIIKSAAAGSQISLITGNNDVAMGNKESVLRVLNALAGKLTYSAYASDDKNLTGYVKIAEGLTASSNALKTGYIAFDENGKGTCGKLLEKTAFTTTLTGNSKNDSEYEDNIATDGSYTFTKDSVISIPEVSKGDAKAINVQKKGLTINAKGVDLNLTTSAKGDASAYGFFQDVGNDETGTAKSSTVTVGTLKTNVSGEFAGNNKGHLSSIYLNGGKVGTRSQLIIDGNVDVTTRNTKGEAIGVCARGDADLTIDGNVKANVNGRQTTAYYGVSGVYATAIWGGGKHGGQIVIKGDVDLSGKGNGLFTNIGDARITVNGGGKIVVDKENNTEGYCAIRAEDGRVNMNMKLDAKGDATESAGHKVNIQGNVAATAGAINGQVYPEGMLTQVNLGLDTADSTLEGLVYDDFGDGRMNGGTTVFHGEANLWLSNGASWTNHEYGKAVNSYYGQMVEGSVVSNFHGGKDEASTGYILQDDINDLTFKTYNGYSTIFYKHSGDGTGEDAYEDYGDVVIKQAATGSHVTLVTDNTGIDTAKRAALDQALNTLAKKLVYSAYVQEETNLSGKVEIASGLTASSIGKVFKSGDISFSKEDGRGFYDIPNVQLKTDFTTAITGNLTGDTEYNDAYVTTDDAYSFTKDSTITTTGAAIQAKKDLTVTSSKKLALHASAASGSVAGISQETDAAGKVSITASKLTINASTTDDYGIASGVFVKRYTENAKNELSVKGDMDIHAVNKKEKAGSANGIYAEGNSKITIDGNVKTLAEGAGSEWGYTYVNGIYAKGTSPYAKRAGAAAEVVVNGNVDISGNGNGLLASLSDSTVTVNGGGKISVNKDNTLGSAAIRAEEGTVNMNVKLDESGNATSSAGHDVQIEGNVAATVGSAVSASDTKGLVTKINLGLDTASSTLTGAIYNAFGAEGTNKNTYGNKLKYTFKGETNLWLSNGAVWNNELYGNVESKYQFTGSLVSNLHGGESKEKAGNIFQKDANSLTIDNYSGYANIYYAHEGNGEAAENYKAGDTIINKATAGSQISLITDNTGIAMDNEYSVANVLNALAGKLTYSNFTKGEKNLTGFVKIADGLTASSKALQTGNIAFSDKDGKGSLAEGTVTPGVTYPEEQVKDTYTQTITGITKDDYIYKQNGVLKEEGKYTFTKDPTKITVEKGSAIDTKADITIDTSKAKLELSGKDAGIKADGHQVSITGSTVITGKDAISASNGGKVTLNGMTDIKAAGEDGTAISVADKDSEVAITGNAAASITGAVYVEGGNLTVNTGATTMTGDVVIDGGKADITLGDKASTLTGDLSVSKGGQLTLNVTNGAKVTGSYAASAGTLTMNVKDGGYWILKDAANTTSLYAISLVDAAEDANAPAAGTLNVNGGRDKAHTGYIDMTERTQNLDIANFSGHETFIMAHEDDGTFTSGDVNIATAAAGSGLTLYTANNGIQMTNKEQVTNTLKAFAQKAFYAKGNDAGNGKNLTGEVKIGEGLTSSSAKTGKIDFSNLRGQLVAGSIQWEPTIETGDYETFVMKGARSAVTTSFHSWRDNMQDTYTGADLADEDGIFAKALGGKTSSDVSGLKDSNSYWGAQIGYDKALANGWHTGVAFDYRDGDSDYLLGGKGDNKLYSFGVYGVKKMDNGSYFRVAAKAGRVENEYDVYTELRNKLHADYKANAYGLTAEYGKTFGSEMSYITPKVQLTWSRVGSKDYTGSANNGATMNIYQDSYDSLVGRLGFEAGMKKAHGSLHAGLYLAHEFNGDIDTRYFAKDGGWKSTSFDGDDTWAELVLGGEYRLGRNSQLYADFARDLGGDFQRKWKLNAGIRLRF